MGSSYKRSSSPDCESTLYLHDLLNELRIITNKTIKCYYYDDSEIDSGDSDEIPYESYTYQPHKNRLGRYVNNEIVEASVRFCWASVDQSSPNCFRVDLDEDIWSLDPSEHTEVVDPTTERSPFLVLFVYPSDEGMKYYDIISYIGDITNIPNHRVWDSSPNIPVMVQGNGLDLGYGCKIAKTVSIDGYVE